jgi:DNA-binding transcriptional LysR family regulator
MVCVMRRTHPLARKAMTLVSFLRCRHLRISMSPTDLRFVDHVLAREELKRDVALNVPHWLVVPHVLGRTDLVSVMPGRLAAALAGAALVARDLPFASEPFDWTLYRHRRHEGNPANRWLRARIRELAGTLKWADACP